MEQPTLEQVQFKFREHIERAAADHGVDRTTVQTFFERLGISDPEMFPLGPGLVVSEATLRTLPEGTQVYCGRLDNWNRFSLYHKGVHGWMPLFGSGYYMDSGYRYPFTIATYPGVDTLPQWWTRKGTPEDAEQISEFKAKAWRIGWRIKIKHGWCPTYDNVMNEAGVYVDDARSVRHCGVTVGDKVSSAQVATLPAGTLLYWASSRAPERTAWYLRDDDASNVAGVSHLWGDSPSLSRLTMEVAAFPPEDDGITRVGCGVYPDLQRWLPILPPGTVFRDDNGTRYLVCDNQYLTQTTADACEVGAYGAQSFNPDSLYLERFPHAI